MAMSMLSRTVLSFSPFHFAGWKQFPCPSRVMKSGSMILTRPSPPFSAASSSPDPASDASNTTQNSGPDDAHIDSSDDDSSVRALVLSIPTMETMEEVGALIAALSRPSDCILLDGDLGSGKTTFSRGFIRCKLGMVDTDDIGGGGGGGDVPARNNALRITSPTYLLSNTYVYRDDGDDDDGPLTRR